MIESGLGITKQGFTATQVPSPGEELEALRERVQVLEYGYYSLLRHFGLELAKQPESYFVRELQQQGPPTMKKTERKNGK